MKLKPIISLSNNENTTWIFTVSDCFFLLYCMNSQPKVLPYLSDIMAMLTFRERAANVTYCADVTVFLHVTSGGLSLTVAFFLCRFLAFYCFKCCLGSFSRYKTVFSPSIIPLKHAEQDQIDAKWLENTFRRQSRRVGRCLIIVNKSIKEKENLIFFSVQDPILFHSGTPKLVFSLVATATCENTAFGGHWMKYNSILHENNQISSIYSEKE